MGKIKYDAKVKTFEEFKEKVSNPLGWGIRVVNQPSGLKQNCFIFFFFEIISYKKNKHDICSNIHTSLDINFCGCRLNMRLEKYFVMILPCA